jgi:hypothetical protein
MGTAEKRLNKMRRNPKDWTIDDVLAVAGEWGIETRSRGGSHVVLSHRTVDFRVTIPAHRPIKQVYIKEFLALIDAITEQIK